MKAFKRLCILVLCASFVFSYALHGYANEVYKCGSGDKKRVALTFDDGPHPSLTNKILDILDAYSLKATFFVIGKNAAEHPEILKRMILSGHEIGNHTYSHPHLSTLSYKELLEEITLGKDLITSITHKPIRLFRPPEGVCSAAVGKAANKNGECVVLWTIDTRDWCSPPTEDIVNSVMKNLSPGAIILFHDYVYENSNTPEALEILIPKILQEGYEIVSVSELLEL